MFAASLDFFFFGMFMGAVIVGALWLATYEPEPRSTKEQAVKHDSERRKRPF